MELSSLPMIELHLHLDGAIPPETMWDLAAAQGLPLPAATLDDFRRWLARTSDCADVNTYLARFELPLQLMQTEERIVRVTRDVLSVLARQGHIYDELPLCAAASQARGAHAAAGRRSGPGGAQAGAGRASGLRRGDSSLRDVHWRETVNMEENLETVRLAKDFLGQGVVGADLAGAEGIVPLRNFRPIFDLARELHVPATCHAGDSQGPDTVRDALSFGVTRIGHGHHIFDDPSLWDEAISRGVTLEICPTSNIQCHTQPSYRAHPAKKLLDAGLRLCINTDNMTLAAVNLPDEYRHCTQDMGFTSDDLKKTLVYAAEATFLPEDKKKALVARVKNAEL